MTTRGRPKTRRRIGGFALAGAIGFAVDAGVLSAGLALGLGPGAARAPSFLAAVLTTWGINRRLTFETRAAASLREFGAYLAAMSLGLSINLAVYLACVWIGVPAVAALVPATGAGMLANYLGARRVLGRDG